MRLLARSIGCGNVLMIDAYRSDDDGMLGDTGWNAYRTARYFCLVLDVLSQELLSGGHCF